MSANIKFYELTGFSNSTYVDAAKTKFSLQPSTIQIHYVSGSNTLYYSFNGLEDHGMVGDDGGQIKTQVHEPFTSMFIYFRGGTGDEIVQVTVTS